MSEGENENVGTLGRDCSARSSCERRLAPDPPGVGDTDDSVGEGEFRHRFCIIWRPWGVKGLEPWLLLGFAPPTSWVGNDRFPPLLLGESLGVDGKDDDRGGNAGADRDATSALGMGGVTLSSDSSSSSSPESSGLSRSLIMSSVFCFLIGDLQLEADAKNDANVGAGGSFLSPSSLDVADP